MKALPREFGVGYPRELLFADDIVIIAKTLEELNRSEVMENWTRRQKTKNERAKTKVICSSQMVRKQRWNMLNFQLTIRSVLKVFNKLLPILTNKDISLSDRGDVFSTCERRIIVLKFNMATDKGEPAQG